MSERPIRIPRRRFLKTAAGTSTLFVVPQIIPASALGRDGAVAPSERIVLGGIGMTLEGHPRLHPIDVAEGNDVFAFAGSHVIGPHRSQTHARDVERLARRLLSRAAQDVAGRDRKDPSRAKEPSP